MTHILLPYAALKEKGIGYSKIQLWRKERAGTFPKRVHFSANRVAWVESEIDAWIAALVASRK